MDLKCAYWGNIRIKDLLLRLNMTGEWHGPNTNTRTVILRNNPTLSPDHCITVLPWCCAAKPGIPAALCQGRASSPEPQEGVDTCLSLFLRSTPWTCRASAADMNGCAGCTLSRFFQAVSSWCVEKHPHKHWWEAQAFGRLSVFYCTVRSVFSAAKSWHWQVFLWRAVDVLLFGDSMLLTKQPSHKQSHGVDYEIHLN